MKHLFAKFILRGQRSTKKTKIEEIVEQEIEQINENEQYKTEMDNTRAMGQRAISSMVGKPETRRDLYKTIQASNNGGSVSPDGTIEELEDLESRGIKPARAELHSVPIPICI